MKALRILISIGVILLISINADAQVNWKKFAYFSNFGGLNDNLSSTEIADNEATDLQNVTFDTGGAIKKRNGYTTIPPIPLQVATGATATGAITGLAFYKTDSGSKYLVAICNQDAKPVVMEKTYDTGGGPSAGRWVNIDNAGLGSSYTDNFQPSFAVAQNILVFSDGTPTSKIYAWNGSGKSYQLSTSVNAPTGSFVVYHKNQLFVSGNSTYPSRVWFSALDDITTYTATDFFDLETSDGSKIQGMISAFDALYIFKDNSIWRLSGTNRDDFVLQKMVPNIGTLSNQSIKVVNNLIYFITRQNDVAVYDGGWNVQFISQKIRGTIGALSFNRAANSIGLAFSSYKYVDFDYYASVSNSPSSTNDTVLMFDTAYKAWTKFSGINANCWTVGDNDSGQNAVYFGDYSGYVHRYPSTTYYDGSVATTAIVGYYQTKWFRYPEVALGDKYWRLLKTYCLSESSTIYLTTECRSDFETAGSVDQINLSSSSAQWDVAQWDIDKWAGTTIITGRQEVEKGVNMFQAKFSNSNVNEGFTIVGFENFIEGSERI